MQPTDGLGNPLAKGDWVMVKRDDNSWILGVVMNISEPSVLASRQPMPMPGQIQVAPTPFVIYFDANNPRVGQAIKVVAPPQVPSNLH